MCFSMIFLIVVVLLVFTTIHEKFRTTCSDKLCVYSVQRWCWLCFKLVYEGIEEEEKKVVSSNLSEKYLYHLVLCVLRQKLVMKKERYVLCVFIHFLSPNNSSDNKYWEILQKKQQQHLCGLYCISSRLMHKLPYLKKRKRN